MILFEAEDAIGVSRLNREIMDFLAIAEPAVAMDDVFNAAIHGKSKVSFSCSEEYASELEDGFLVKMKIMW